MEILFAFHIILFIYLFNDMFIIDSFDINEEKDV